MERQSLIFILGRELSPHWWEGVPDSIRQDPANEVLRLVDRSTSISRELSGDRQCRVLQCSDAGGMGGDIKIALRYALDRGYRNVLVLPEAGEFSRKIARAHWRGLQKAGVSFCLASEGDQKKLLAGKPVGAFFGIRRDYLEQIPFERNSNDSLFLNEFVLQCSMLHFPIHHEVAQGLRSWVGTYAKNGLPVSIHSSLCKAGFFYDRKFDLSGHDYPAKGSRFSSHSQILRAVPANSRVLDVGCGKGFLARELVAKGCSVDGIDLLPKEQVADCLSDYHQVNLNHGLDQFAEILKKKSYDVILLADVIEHLVEPEKFLELIREWQHGGKPPLVLVCTGNVAFCIVRTMLALGQFNYAPRGILDRTHTRLFTRKSFAQIFRQAGFEIVKKQWVPMPFSIVLPNRKIAIWAERVNQWLTWVRPGIFAYQMFFTVRPFPTTSQLLGGTVPLSHPVAEAEGLPSPA